MLWFHEKIKKKKIREHDAYLNFLRSYPNIWPIIAEIWDGLASESSIKSSISLSSSYSSSDSILYLFDEFFDLVNEELLDFEDDELRPMGEGDRDRGLLLLLPFPDCLFDLLLLTTAGWNWGPKFSTRKKEEIN